MKHHNAAWFRGQRSQGLTEFALIAPVILLLTFGITAIFRVLPPFVLTLYVVITFGRAHLGTRRGV